MDRSQAIIIWMMSLCFSVAPFWSASETSGIEAEAEAAMTDMVGAFDTLDEDVQSELFFKRLIIEAIDTSMEINDALGFESTSTLDRVLVVPAWLLASRVILGVQGPIRMPIKEQTPGSEKGEGQSRKERVRRTGLTSDLRRITHDRRLMTGEAHAQLNNLVRDYFNKESALRTAQERLGELRSKAAVEAEARARAAASATSAADTSVPPAEDGVSARRTATTGGATASGTVVAKSIDELNLNSSIKSILKREGITTVDKLRQQTRKGLLQIEGLGSGSVSKIQRVMARIGQPIDMPALAQQTQEGKATGDAERTAQAEDSKTTGDAERTTQAEEGRTAGDAERTAQAEEGRTAGDAERTTQAEEGRTAGDAERTAQAEEGRRSFRRRGRAAKGPGISTQTTAELIASQENIVKNLQTEVSELRTGIANNMRLKLGKAWYRVGRFVRGLGLTAIVFAGISAQAVIFGDMVMVVFNFQEDMEDLRAQYVQDIEEVMGINVDASSY